MATNLLLIGRITDVMVPNYKESVDPTTHARFTSYRVQFTCNGHRLEVLRRYNDFRNFHEALLHSRPDDVKTFRFPRKSRLNTFSKSTLDRRRQGFQEYLQLVAQSIPQPDELHEFLQMNARAVNPSDEGGGLSLDANGGAAFQQESGNCETRANGGIDRQGGQVPAGQDHNEAKSEEELLLPVKRWRNHAQRRASSSLIVVSGTFVVSAPSPFPRIAPFHEFCAHIHLPCRYSAFLRH